MRVLLAEDNPLARRALAAGLTKDGHEVMLAEDGEQALALAHGRPPDFIISDVLMPHMDGFSLCQAIREDEELRDIPLIFYSATFLDPEDQELARSVGANGFISKTSDPDSFRHQLYELLDTSKKQSPYSFSASPEGSAEFRRQHAAALIRKLHKKVGELEEEREALHESQRFLNQIFTAIPDVIFVVEIPDFSLTFVAPGAERLLGYSTDELMGSPSHWHSLIDEEDRERVKSELTQMVLNRQSAVIVARMRHKQGGVRWVEARVFPRLNDEGSPVELVGSVTDVTSREQAKVQLVESEERYRKLFEMMESGVSVNELIFDASGQPIDCRFIAVNPVFERLTGLKRDAVVGHTLYEVLPGLEEAWLADYIKLAKCGEPSKFIRYIPALDCYFEAVIYSIGQNQFVTLFSDITEHQRADEKIQSLARFPAENPSPVLRINDRGELLYSNPAANVMLQQYCEKQGDGRCEDLISAGINALQSSTIGYMDYPIEGKYYSFVITPFADAGYANLYGRDITDQVQAAQELKRLNRVLHTLSQSNRLLVHATSESELLNSVCTVLVENGEYPLVWLASHDTSGILQIKGQYGRELQEKQPCLQAFVRSPQLAVHINETLQTNEPVLITELDAEWPIAEQRAVLAASGLLVLLLLPITHKENRYGVMGIFSITQEVFDLEEMELLNEMAGDVAYGIHALRTQRAHEEGMNRIQRTMLQTIEAVSLTLEKRDPYTAGHQQRVVQLAVAIASELGLSKDRIEGIRLGALVHDIGKIYVPAEILNRPGRLTEAEFGIIKTHPEVGYDILKGVDFDWPIAKMVLQHHERFDGSGYPNGLKGEQIVIEARILGVADVVEAITSHRPYRAGLGLEVALDEISSWRGIRYDPVVVDACLRLFREQGFTWDLGETLAPGQ